MDLKMASRRQPILLPEYSTLEPIMLMNLQSPPLLPVDNIKAIQPISGWHDFLEEGEAYLHTAKGAHANGRKVFTPEILYNIIAMSIEKFVMAALMKHGALPYNHTMADLVFAMDDVFPGYIGDIRDELLNLDHYQDICDAENFTIISPDAKEIPGMLSLGEKLQDLVHLKTC